MWVITVHVDLRHLPEVVFVRFLDFKVSLSHFSKLYSLEKSIYVQLILKEWGFMLPYLGGGWSIKLFGINGFFLHLYLFNHLFIYLYQHGLKILILCFGLYFNTSLLFFFFNFVAQIVSALLLGNLPVGFALFSLVDILALI